MEQTPSSQRLRTCRACGTRFEYPLKGSAATRHHCAACAVISPEIRQTLERLSTRVTQLENHLRRLK